MATADMTTLDSILSAAMKEFLEKGYPGAGLRDIAKKAGVTTGALYGYFRSKEDLFEALAGEPYRQILALYRQILCEFTVLDPGKQAASLAEYTARGMKVLCDYMYQNHDAFKLILCKSEGTAYSGLVHEMAQMDVSATHDFAETTAGAGHPVKPVNPVLEHMLTIGMFSAFFELIVDDVPQEEAEEYIRQMLEFYIGGWSKIMGF